MRVLCQALAIPALVCIQAGCSGSSDAPPVQDTAPGAGAVRTNLGLPALDLIARLPLVAFGVSEVEQGGADLNGDGDGLDIVLHVYDERTRVITNTGLSPRAELDPLERKPVLMGDRIMFAVSEAAQGADLNGDLDQADYVVHSFDAVTAAAENHGLALVQVERGGLALNDPRFAVIVVSEFDQGMADWNGDGDSHDGILHIVDLENGDVARHPDPLGYIDWQHVGVADGYVFFVVREAEAARDLNGDADMEDWTVFVGDLSSGLILNTGISAWTAAVLPGGVHTWRVDEEAQGGSDLDGDGDATDLVYASYDLASGELRTHGVAVHPPPLGPITAKSSAGRVVVTAQEAASQDDWNGDGDRSDRIMVLLDPPTGAVTSTGLHASWPAYQFVDGRFALPIEEGATNGGSDLNGDGDSDDFVMQLVDPMTGSATNLGVDVELVLDPCVLACPMERFLLFHRSEQDNAQDWNQDGDTLDTVLTWWDAHTNTFHRTDHSVLRVADLLGTTALVHVAEESEGRDLNGDGDQLDSVLFAIDLAKGTRVNLRCSGDDPKLIAPDRFLVSVSESESGEDLNADGDLDDSVLVAFDLFR